MRVLASITALLAWPCWAAAAAGAAWAKESEGVAASRAEASSAGIRVFFMVAVPLQAQARRCHRGSQRHRYWPDR